MQARMKNPAMVLPDVMQPVQAGQQVVEALGPQQQLANDQQRPPLADDVEAAGDPALVAITPVHAPSVAL